MEFGTREILIAVGVLVILAILLDGLRRVRAARNGTIRVAKRRQPVFDDAPFEEYPSELPSGGARVVAVRDEESVEGIGQEMKKSILNSPKRVTSVFQMHSSDPQFRARDTDASDAVERDSQTAPADVTPAPAPGADSRVAHAAVSPNVQTAPFREHRAEREAQATQPAAPEQSTVAAPDRHADAGREPLLAPGGPNRSGSHGRMRESESDDKAVVPEVIVLHLMSHRGEVFAGRDLLDALLRQGFRYGSMKIFHRHQSSDGTGAVLFSVANLVKPGTFDLNAMEDFTTPGITFFMALDGLERPLQIFDLLYNSVQAIATELDGELKDETRSALTRQTVEHYRQRILDFTRRSFALSH